VNNLAVVIPLAAVVGILQTSLFEWVYHRSWLHRPWLPPAMFTAHTLVHHQLCKHDDTFHVTEPEQEEALTFQWWAAPILIALNMLPYAIAALLFHAWGNPAWTAVMCTVGGIVLLYYFAYEGFHYLMHKPSLPWIERRGFFKFIERHHKLHHVYMGKNFNVVLPLADLLLGTLVLTDPLPAKVTEPAARQVARRHSKWGQRLREEAEARAHQSAGSLPDNVAVPPEH
jgi:hypothetical protein